MVTVEEVRHFCLTLPEAEELDHWGKPSFRIRNKIFVALREDGTSLIVKVSPEDKMIFTTMEPETYHIPPTFSNMNFIIVQIDAVNPVELWGLIQKAWRSLAPKRLVKQYDAEVRKLL
jgi:hypothetical protein